MITRIFQDIDELEGEWTTLLERLPDSSPFQKPLYNQIWWTTLGGGEWAYGEPWLLAGYDAAGTLVGIAPLFLSEADGRSLRFIGSLEISDYLDFIMDPNHAKAFLESVLTQALESDPPGNPILTLDNLLEDSPTVDLLNQIAEAHGWQFDQERVEPAPLLALPASMEAYLENLSSKQRREFRRKMRRAAEYPAQVTWRIVEQPDHVPAAIETFLGLMENDAEKRAFLSESMRQHFQQLALNASAAGWLHLAFLEVSAEPIFGYLNFIDKNKIWVYNSGFDPEHFALSPGWVLMGYLIEWAIENGIEAIDFMRGDEQYKYRLGGSDRFVCQVTIQK